MVLAHRVKANAGTGPRSIDLGEILQSAVAGD
jgi:hypothetical protein